MNDKLKTAILTYKNDLAILNIKIIDADLGYVKACMPITKDSLNPFGFAHGGVLFTLCDTLSGLALCTYESKAVTLQSNINYLKSAYEGMIYAECHVEHKGGRTAVTEVKVYNKKNEIYCIASFTMYIIDKIE